MDALVEPISKKRNYKFNKKHLVQYGLRLGEINVAYEVITVICHFCETSGRENTDRLLKKSKVIKSYKEPFRCDNYLKHIKLSHDIEWNTFSKLIGVQKENYFDNFNKKITNFFKNKKKYEFIISKEIVEKLITMLYNNDDEDYVINKLSLKQNESEYIIEINNIKCFDLTLSFVSAGSSFRLASKNLNSVKTIGEMHSLGNCSEIVIREYIRYCCIINMQVIKDVLQEAWTFSIALDMGTCSDTPYLDVRIRFYSSKTINVENIHLMAIPIYERHTAAIMFEVS